ncbi:MAG: M23 family metallopeptidase [bacterium]
MGRTTKPKYLTIMVVPDGGDASRGFRMRTWVWRSMMVGGLLAIIAAVIAGATYTRVASRAWRAGELEKENDRLRLYHYKVVLLEENLNRSREIVARLAALAGIDYEFPSLPDDSTLFAAVGESPSASLPRPPGAAHDWPVGLPIQGFITQDFEMSDSVHYHPGVDIACAVGTPVLATAAGTVEEAIYDSTYGYVVVVRHNDSVTTAYGHNDSLLVDSGRVVAAGSRLALSGNTGISSAPHLHYELRVNNQPIDPLETAYNETY